MYYIYGSVRAIPTHRVYQLYKNNMIVRVHCVLVSSGQIWKLFHVLSSLLSLYNIHHLPYSCSSQWRSSRHTCHRCFSLGWCLGCCSWTVRGRRTFWLGCAPPLRDGWTKALGSMDHHWKKNNKNQRYQSGWFDIEKLGMVAGYEATNTLLRSI